MQYGDDCQLKNASQRFIGIGSSRDSVAAIQLSAFKTCEIKSSAGGGGSRT